MSDFLRFVDELHRRFPIHMQIYLSKIMDWCITITKKGCADDYPKSRRDGNDAVLCQVQDSSMEICFAKAYVALTDWLDENNGGI